MPFHVHVHFVIKKHCRMADKILIGGVMDGLGIYACGQISISNSRKFSPLKVSRYMVYCYCPCNKATPSIKELGGFQGRALML